MHCSYCNNRGCPYCRSGKCPYCKGVGCPKCMGVMKGKKECNCNRDRYWLLIFIIIALLAYIFYKSV